MNKPVIVFGGTSISRAEVLAALPHADVRGPVREADLKDIPAGSIVAIIDGPLDSDSGSITTNELRSAIARGIRILGSSAIGAVRANEVAEMLGVGRVYELYQSGSLDFDDEVAVKVKSDGTRATEALVNVRYAVSELVSSGSLRESDGESILHAAEHLKVDERSYPNIMRAAGLDDRADVDLLIAGLSSFDLQRQDAMTLLESIDRLADGADARRTHDLPSVDSTEEGDGAHKEVQTASTTDPMASVMVWEYGEAVDFGELVSFMALSGTLDEFARRALLRLYQAGSNPRVSAEQAATVQDLFEATCETWGWSTTEEIHVTLRDLNIGKDTLEAGFGAEAEIRELLSKSLTNRSRSLMTALRFELLTYDLALKREAMRLAALTALAAGAVDATEEELEDSRRAFFQEAMRLITVSSWEELLEHFGLEDAACQPLLRKVALARRVGVPLLEKMTSPAGVESKKLRLELLPAASYVSGSARSLSDDEALVRATKLKELMGITRIAQIPSRLEGLADLFVARAHRASNFSSSVACGKSETREGAVIGAVMEELEKYCLEAFVPEATAAAFRDLASDTTINPKDLGLPFDSTYSADQSVEWSWALDLVSGDRFAIPASLLTFSRLRRDPLFSPRLAKKTVSSNGVAAGFTLTEAILHGLCEIIERHAMKLSEQETTNPGRLPGAAVFPFEFIDLDSCPASTQGLCERIRGGGFEIRVVDVAVDTRVPTFDARIFRPGKPIGAEGVAYRGHCTHPRAETAINRAILEAVQSLMGKHDGSDRLSIQARSLGRHERPRPMSLGATRWLSPWVPKRRFTPGFVGSSAREELGFVVDRMVDVGFDKILYRDISRPEVAPGAVVRVIVPGTEGINPLFTGPRARVHVVRELMRRHTW